MINSLRRLIQDKRKSVNIFICHLFTVCRADSGREMEECSTVCSELIQAGIWRNALQCAESFRQDMEECSTVCRELIQAGIWRNAVQCAES